MKIFSEKWRTFTIGSIAVIILIILQSWWLILAVPCLLMQYPTDNPPNNKEQFFKSRRQMFYTLVALPLVSLVGNALQETGKEMKAERELTAITKEEHRLKTALTWDIDNDPSLTDHEKAFVKKAADNLIQNEEKCSNLRMGGKSTTYEDQYYLDCESFKIYFSEEEIADGRTFKIRRTL